jgi:hypothetical protein
MKIVSYVLAVLLFLLGLIFLLGAQGQILRLAIGVVLLVGAAVVIYLTRMQPKVTETTVVQKIDLSGDVSLEGMTCQACGAPLSKESIEVRAGAIFVNCEHCNAAYQFEEEPKW